MRFPPQDLACPNPSGCPIAPTLPGLNAATVQAGTPWFRVYDSTWGYDEHNPGRGDSRFSPFDAISSGQRVPAMYLAATQTAALLETVFHEVHHLSARTIYEKDLIGKLMAHVRMPTEAHVGDLRDSELAIHHLRREQIVSGSAEHYPCTRRLAAAVHDKPLGTRPLQGLIWHSRQAELNKHPPTEVLVLFGDHYPSGRGTWDRSAPGSSALFDGPGRLLVDEVAEELDAIVQMMS